MSTRPGPQFWDSGWSRPKLNEHGWPLPRPEQRRLSACRRSLQYVSEQALIYKWQVSVFRAFKIKPGSSGQSHEFREECILQGIFSGSSVSPSRQRPQRTPGTVQRALLHGEKAGVFYHYGVVDVVLADELDFVVVASGGSEKPQKFDVWEFPPLRFGLEGIRAAAYERSCRVEPRGLPAAAAAAHVISVRVRVWKNMAIKRTFSFFLLRISYHTHAYVCRTVKSRYNECPRKSNFLFAELRLSVISRLLYSTR